MPSPRFFARASVFKLLPALLVGLIPFDLLDQALLSRLYRIRGERPGPAAIKVVLVRDPEEMSDFLRVVRPLTDLPCINLSRWNPGERSCLFLPVEEISRPREIFTFAPSLARFLGREVPPPFHADGGIQPLYYGNIAVFRPLTVPEAIASVKSLFGPGDILVFAPTSPVPTIPAETPAGSLNQVEIALNMVGNAFEERSLASTSRTLQVMHSAAASALVAWILYSYPIVLTAVLTLLLGLVQLILALVVFDTLDVQLLAVAPLVAMLTAYLLGLSDRLNSREREAWSLEQRSESLRELDEMKSNFLSLISHDLKTPIAKMQAMLERMAHGELGSLTPTQNETLSRILSANGHLQRTISTLLLLNRIETGQFQIRREPTDLLELIDETTKAHQGPAQDRNIRIEKELEPLFLAEVDRGLIREVINNLLDNALKYSPAASVISVRCGELDNSPDLSPPQPAIWIEIQDRGTGIPPQDRERVRQKFVRGSNENTAADQSVKGTGLGLFLSGFFVEKHAGHMRIVSRTRGEPYDPGSPAAQYFAEDESGTVVRISLPVDESFLTPEAT